MEEDWRGALLMIFSKSAQLYSTIHLVYVSVLWASAGVVNKLHSEP